MELHKRLAGRQEWIQNVRTVLLAEESRQHQRPQVILRYQNQQRQQAN